ncbi:MAG: cytochrome P450 [Mycobacterium sp.]
MTKIEEAPRFDPRLSAFTQSVADMANPQKIYHDKAANVRAERIDGVVHLYRQADIVAINRHPAVLGTGGRGGSFGHDGKLIPLEIDGSDHKKWRRLLDPMFSPKQVVRLEDSVRGLARELIDKFAEEGKADLAEDFSVPLPCLTFLRLLGAPVEDLDFFLEFKDGVIHPKGDTMEEQGEHMAAAGAKLMGYFNDFLAKRRAAPEKGDDVIGALLTAEVDGEPLNEFDLLNILFLFMFAGLDTVTSSMSCTFAWLAQHPDELKRLVDDPSLIPAAVEEIMRYESPVPSGMRYADDEIDLGDGLVIHKGEAMHPIWAAGNVDPNAYPDPLTVDFSRRPNHIVFASGTHRCLGSHLARLEMRLAVEEMLKRIPTFSIAPDEKLIYDNVAVRNVVYLPIVFEPSTSE